MLRIEKIYFLGGWSGSLILTFLLLLTEIILNIIGGDQGAFMFVTFHFILIPLLSIIVLVITGIKICKIQERTQKIIILTSIIIPISILYISITGNTILIDILKINFSN